MSWMQRIGCLAWLVLVVSPAAGAEPAWSADQLTYFEKHIRPVLASQCWNCHSASKAESGLRLDSRAAVLKGGDRGPAATPRETEAGWLMQAIRRSGDLVMPPNGTLTSAQVDAFSRWIQMGLPWPEEAAGSALSRAWQTHWAFQPVRRPEVPDLARDAWSSSPVDRFVVAANPEARPRASRATLIRRLSFDLLGLPPTPDDVAEFEADRSPDAWERLVDRLLASPRHGERWGRYWLDVARYADTKGYVFFEEPTYPWAYTFRDYVIRSLNADLPYDRFLQEQIAADQFAGADLAALGFLTVGGHFMGNVHDIVDDRIDVVTRGVMGLTVTCARCHDHKYDPIPTADYYSLYGIFRSSVEPLVLPLAGPVSDTLAYRQFCSELSLRRQALDDFVAQKHAELVTGARMRSGEYLVAALAAEDNPPTDDFMLIADPGDLNPAMIVRWQSYLKGLRRSQPAVSSAGARPASHPVWGPWLTLSPLPPEGFAERAAALLAEPGVNPRVREALQGTAPPGTRDEVARRYGVLFASVHRDWQAKVREAVILKQPDPQALDDAAAEEVRAELYGPGTPADVPLVFGWGFLSLLPDRASQGQYQKLLKDVEHWLIHGPGAPARSMVLLDGPIYEPHVFARGNPQRPGLAVPRRFLTALEPQARPVSSGSGRRELAVAVTAAGNPLTARVAVNRAWQHHLGLGLVRSPGDFGLRSDPPTHPELLDWLSADFVNGGQAAPSPLAWSLKRLHRQIVSSSTYQQSSQGHSDTDPDNRMLARANRRRLDFEATRDALLAVTGRMDDRIGGPSQTVLGGGFHPRRTVYAQIDRQDPPGLLSVFDVPSPAATSPARDTTTIAPQALYLMNGPLVVSCAERVLSREDVSACATVESRLEMLYRILLGRRPRDDERQVTSRFLGASPSPAQWTSLVQGLMMTNEFVFVD